LGVTVLTGLNDTCRAAIPAGTTFFGSLLGLRVRVRVTAAEEASGAALR
jgi:hypothetical protein